MTQQDEMPSAPLHIHCAEEWYDYADALRASCERLVLASEHWQREFGKMTAERDEFRNEVERINRVAATGTVENWLKLPDADKAKWFASMLHESSERKKERERAESAESQLAALREGRAELVKRLLDNSCGSEERDEMLLETGKMTGLGVPKEVGEAIILWNDLLREAAAALKDGSGG